MCSVNPPKPLFSPDPPQTSPPPSQRSLVLWTPYLLVLCLISASSCNCPPFWIKDLIFEIKLKFEKKVQDVDKYYFGGAEGSKRPRGKISFSLSPVIAWPSHFLRWEGDNGGVGQPCYETLLLYDTTILGSGRESYQAWCLTPLYHAPRTSCCCN